MHPLAPIGLAPRRVSRARGALLGVATLALLAWAPGASALTSPISGAVRYPAAGPKLSLPFPAGSKINLLSGYGPSGGSSLHADTNATGKANDHYALDLVYDGQPNSGKGLPVVAPIAGKVVKAGWATSGWANYGQRVILEHDLGDGHKYHSLYAHLDSVAVTEGATVPAGKKLGTLGQSCQGALSCASFATPHLHWALHRDSLVGGSGTGGSYGGNAVVPEPMDGAEDLIQGRVITSQNSSAPVCGDAICSGAETPATCPADCKVCEPIPPQGRTLSEREPLCFKTAGSPRNWQSAAAGHDGALMFTLATSDPKPDNYATWDLEFAEAGDYRVDVYTAKPYAQSQRARYTVRHGTQTSQAIIDQTVVDGWQSLGTFSFARGDGQSLRLDDNTGEAVALKRQLVFDAIRLTRAGVVDGGGVGTAGDAGPVGDAGPASASGGPSVTGASDLERLEDETGGCQIRAGATSPEAAVTGVLALALAALGRRRRRAA